MVNVHLKDTNINITCETVEELYSLHFNLSYKYDFIINGVEIRSVGPMEGGGYFAGFTREWFKKNFFEK